MNAKTGSDGTLDPARSAPPRMAARTKMILEAPILATLLRLALPNVLNLLAITGMITFDALFIGRLGVEALVGVSLVFPFVMFVQHAVAGGLGGAVASSIARAIGAGEKDKADTLAAHAVWLAIAMALVCAGVMLAAGPIIFKAMGGQGAALEAALAYSNVIFAGIISICMLNILANIVRGTGNMSLPAQVLLGSVLGHIVLSPLLIFGWGPMPPLGTAGAGWGMVISFAIGSVVLFVYLRAGRALVNLPLRGVRYQWGLFKDILTVGIPGIVNVGATNLAVVLLTSIAGRLGQDAAIGYAMGARLEYIIIPLSFGFGTALVAMVGTNWGAKQYERTRRIAWIGALTVAVFCGALGLFFALLPSLWMGMFTEQAQIARIGTLYLQIVAPCYAFYGIGMALYSVLQGVGIIVPAVLANIARLFISAAGAYLAAMWLNAGPVGMFIAIAAGFVFHGIVSAWLLLRTLDPVTAISQKR
jgi:putative MATE family efflux protein